MFVDDGAVIEYCFRYVGTLPRWRLFVVRTVFGTIVVFMRMLRDAAEAVGESDRTQALRASAHL